MMYFFLYTSETIGAEIWHQLTGRGTEDFSFIESFFLSFLGAEISHPFIGHRTADFSSVQILFCVHLGADRSRDIAPIHRPLHRAFSLP